MLSQQPGCVVDPSYVMNASVFGIKERNEICLIGVEEPVNDRNTKAILLKRNTEKVTLIRETEKNGLNSFLNVGIYV